MFDADRRIARLLDIGPNAVRIGHMKVFLELDVVVSETIREETTEETCGQRRSYLASSLMYLLLNV